MMRKIKLLMLMLFVVCATGCGNGDSSETDGIGSSDWMESTTLEPTLEAIVENMMPEGEMISQAGVFITGNNDMIGILAEIFDKEYYAIDDRLKEMVAEDLKQFNDTYKTQNETDKDALVCNGLGLVNDYVVLSMRFRDWNAYVEYMATEVYEETSVTVASLKKKDTLEGSFSAFDGTATDAETILKETKKAKYHIIQAKGDMTVYLQYPIAYISEGAEIVDEYTVKASEDGVIIIMK